MRMTLLMAMIMLGALYAAADASPNILTTKQWRADLAQLDSAIRELHFKPFHNLSEEEFSRDVRSLHDAIPEKSDKAIAVAMAQIVARLRDGHTRLHLPREHPGLAMEAELGHSGTPPPHHPGLRFGQAPLQFGLFADGVFIIGATDEHRGLVGQEVVAFEGTPIDEALKTVRSVSFFENDSRAMLFAPDRLALPEVLAELGVIDAADRFVVTTRTGGSEALDTVLRPLEADATPPAIGVDRSQPLYLRHRDMDHWYQVLPNDDAIYVQVNRFAENPSSPYSDFVASTITDARKAGVSRYIVDLRHNSGGLGTWVIPFLTGVGSSEFNRHGRLYILMGRTTFSAAQQFLHRFEEYSYALFVGEPSGAKPSHYGDGKRVVLEHSGMTLRVSTIYWHSWLANDFRDAIQAHIDAPLTSADFFAGQDPALTAALGYEPTGSIAAHAATQIRQNKNQNGLLLLQRYLTDGRFADHGRIVPDLHAEAQRLIDDGFIRPGYLMLWLTDFYFPGDTTTQALLKQAKNPDGEIDRVMIDPGT